MRAESIGEARRVSPPGRPKGGEHRSAQHEGTSATPPGRPKGGEHRSAQHEATAGTAAACPKCRHIRQPTDIAPAWQCPVCKIAYEKISEFGDSELRFHLPGGGVYYPRHEPGPAWRRWLAVTLAGIGAAAGYHVWTSRHAVDAEAEPPSSAASAPRPKA